MKPLITIVFPSSDMVHSRFTGCLVNLVTYTASLGYRVAVANPRCSIVQIGRYIGIQEARQMKADKVLFVDSDQTFSYDALINLLNANKKIIGAASLTRAEPIEYTTKDKNGERIDFSQRKGLHEVHTNGFPLTLIDMEVFDNIPEPYFNVSFKDGQFTGEDESFCHEARKAGYKIWVDADVKVGHLGIKCYE